MVVQCTYHESTAVVYQTLSVFRARPCTRSCDQSNQWHGAHHWQLKTLKLDPWKRIFLQKTHDPQLWVLLVFQGEAHPSVGRTSESRHPWHHCSHSIRFTIHIPCSSIDITTLDSTLFRDVNSTFRCPRIRQTEDLISFIPLYQGRQGAGAEGDSGRADLGCLEDFYTCRDCPGLILGAFLIARGTPKRSIINHYYINKPTVLCQHALPKPTIDHFTDAIA